MGGAGRAAATGEEQIRAERRAGRLSTRLGVPGPPRKTEPPHDASCAGNPGGRLEVTDDSGCQRLPLAQREADAACPTVITQGRRQPPATPMHSRPYRPIPGHGGVDKMAMPAPADV